MLLAGLFLVVGSMLGGLLLFDSVTSTTPVLVASRDLDPGQVLTESDVAVENISLPPGTPALTFDERRFLGGEETGQPVRALRSFIPEGSILTEEHFINRSDAVEDGKALVGMRLVSGEYPSGLRLGDQVELFRVAARGGAGEEAVYLGRAEVWRIWLSASEADRTEDLIVDLVVDEELQGATLQAHADDVLRLTVVRGE